MYNRTIRINPARPEQTLPTITAGRSSTVSLVLDGIPQPATAVQLLVRRHGEQAVYAFNCTKDETGLWTVRIDEGFLAFTGRGTYEVTFSHLSRYWASKGVLDVVNATTDGIAPSGSVEPHNGRTLVTSVNGAYADDDGNVALDTGVAAEAQARKEADRIVLTDLLKVIDEEVNPAINKKQDVLSEEQVNAIAAVNGKQDKLTPEQIAAIASVSNKQDKLSVDQLNAIGRIDRKQDMLSESQLSAIDAVNGKQDAFTIGTGLKYTNLKNWYVVTFDSWNITGVIPEGMPDLPTSPFYIYEDDGSETDTNIYRQPDKSTATGWYGLYGSSGLWSDAACNDKVAKAVGYDYEECESQGDVLEIDGTVALKSDLSGKADAEHNHDDKYASKSELAGKADALTEDQLDAITTVINKTQVVGAERACIQIFDPAHSESDAIYWSDKARVIVFYVEEGRSYLVLGEPTPLPSRDIVFTQELIIDTSRASNLQVTFSFSENLVIVGDEPDFSDGKAHLLTYRRMFGKVFLSEQAVFDSPNGYGNNGENQ